jgi:hypothetical protein
VMDGEFKKLDADGDGKVTAQEVARHRSHSPPPPSANPRAIPVPAGGIPRPSVSSYAR